MNNKLGLRILSISIVALLLVTIASCTKVKTVAEETEEIKNKVMDWNRLNNKPSEQGLDSLLNAEIYFNGNILTKSEYQQKIKENKFYDQT